MAGQDFVVSTHGVRSPRIIYGTAWKKMRTQELVHAAIAQGFRGIDTACQPRHYHEAGVGAALAACLKQRLAPHASCICRPNLRRSRVTTRNHPL